MNSLEKLLSVVYVTLLTHTSLIKANDDLLQKVMGEVGDGLSD